MREAQAIGGGSSNSGSPASSRFALATRPTRSKLRTLSQKRMRRTSITLADTPGLTALKSIDLPDIGEARTSGYGRSEPLVKPSSDSILSAATCRASQTGRAINF